MKITKKQEDLIYGRQPILEALKHQKKFDKIMLQRGATGDILNDIKQLAGDLNIFIQQVPIEKLNRITRKNHQGVIGFAALVDYYQIEDVLPTIYDKGEVPLLLLLDGITDVRNFGAIARTAACAKAHAIILPQKGSAQVNGEAMRTSAGGLTKIDVIKTDSLLDIIKYLQLNGIQTIGLDLRGNKNLSQSNIDLSIPTAIVMGSEDQGISDEVLKKLDHIVTLPMPGEQLSYNVSVATGMILYEVMKQRNN